MRIMNFKIKVFLSYSILDKIFAERLVEELKNYPFMEIFMAPEDIKAGTFWVDELRYNLKSSDVILSLLTENYHKADWTEQEMGLAWAFEKRVLAISIDGNMGNGYVKTTQIKKFPKEFKAWDITDLAIDLYPSISDKREFVEGLLKFSLLASRSFYQSNSIARLVQRLVNELDSTLAFFVAEAFCKNDQVYYANTWNNLIEKALYESNPFIHFAQRERRDVLRFIKENNPDHYEALQKRINEFKNLKK